jgi:hypothetical protein
MELTVTMTVRVWTKDVEEAVNTVLDILARTADEFGIEVDVTEIMESV